MMNERNTQLNGRNLVWNRGKQLPRHAVPAVAASVVQMLDGLREQIRTDELPDRQAVDDAASQLEAAGSELAGCALSCLAAADGLRAVTGKANGRLPSLTKIHAEYLREHVGHDVVIARTKVSQLRWARARLISVGDVSAVVEHDGVYWETPVEQTIIVHDNVPELLEAIPVEPVPSSPVLPDPEPLTPTPSESAYFAHVGHGELSNVLQYLTFTEHSGRLDVDPEDGHSTGHVFLDRHRVIHAEYEGQNGLNALALLLQLECGSARFYIGDAGTEETLTLPTDQLMLEAAVLADELGQSNPS